MTLRTLVVGTVAVAATAAPAARAQTPPAGDPTDITGTVSSLLELTLTQPAAATFSTFSTAKTYSTSISARVTATDMPTYLTLADGDAASGARLGHLAAGSRLLPRPLEASVKGAFQPLDATVDPLLAKWTDLVTHGPATIRLRQAVTGKPKGTYRKLVLVTLSSATP